MSQVFAPYGFIPIGVLGQEYNTNGMGDFPLTTETTAAISIGDPVGIAAGSIIPTTAVATTTQSAQTPIGICQGFTYIDAMGKLWEAPYLPMGAIAQGLTKIRVKVIDDPNALMKIQPNNPSIAFLIGQNCSYTGFGTNGNKNNSTIALDTASLANTGTLALRIVRIDNPDDLFPDVIVKWNFGVHYYQQGTSK